jgi:hypothetical protein
MGLSETAAVVGRASCAGSEEIECEGMLTLFALKSATICEERCAASCGADAGSASVDQLSAESILIRSPVKVLDRAMVLD